MVGRLESMLTEHSRVFSIAVAAVLAAFGTSCGTETNHGTSVPSHASVTLELVADEIRISWRGRQLTSFHFSERWDKPFLYPLRTASGITVSRGYPLEPRPGEERDHDWHRGIWYGHGDIGGHDFWRELGRDKTGTIVLLKDPVLAEEPDGAGFSAELGFQTPEGDLVGSMVQRYSFSVVDTTVLIDATLSFRADQGRELRFGDTEDGGFAMRLADEFRQESGAVLRNSAGKQDTEHIWGESARWVDYSATIGEQPVGVVMLDHPKNPRHPTRWHARGYSLCSANPFGARDFTGDEDSDGSFVVEEQGELILRYRVIIHEGADAEQIEYWYREFAATGSTTAQP